jgi:hypothetical protein
MADLGLAAVMQALHRSSVRAEGVLPALLERQTLVLRSNVARDLLLLLPFLVEGVVL